MANLLAYFEPYPTLSFLSYLTIIVKDLTDFYGYDKLLTTTKSDQRLKATISPS